MVRAPAKSSRSRPSSRATTRARGASSASRKLAAPATHDDPRFTQLLAALAADRKLRGVAEAYAVDQMSGGTRKFGSRALKVNGKIFGMLSHGRFVVKLPAAQVDAMVAAGEGEYFDPGHGRKMKQWLSITSAKPSWLALARAAHAFVAATRDRSADRATRRSV